jgi:flagellar assembly protein FliH
MSSSKIIRKGGEPHRPFTLEPLANDRPEPEPDLFKAVRLGHEEEEEAEEEEELPPPPPSIPEEEALRLIREAREEGEQEGKRQGDAELAKMNDTFAQALLSIGTLRARLLHEAEEDLLKLSVLIARKIVLRELACDPGVLAGLVYGAVELAADGGEVVVRLNPEDHALVMKRPEFQELLSDQRSIAIKADPVIGPAGCLVETVRGNIDAGLDAQLDELFRELAEEKTARREQTET